MYQNWDWIESTMTTSFNSLVPTDPYGEKEGSTLTQTLAWCLTTPGHCLNQYWVIIIEGLWHSPGENFTWNAQDIFLDIDLNITKFRLQPYLQRAIESISDSVVAYNGMLMDKCVPHNTIQHVLINTFSLVKKALIKALIWHLLLECETSNTTHFVPHP